MERIDFEKNNLEFLHAVVDIALNGASDEDKALGREFIRRVNEGEIAFSPGINTLSIGSRRSTVDESITVFVPFPFGQFIGHCDVESAVLSGLKKAISLHQN